MKTSAKIRSHLPYAHLALLASCLAVFMPMAEAQTAEITGTILDAQRAVVSGAAITVINENTQVPRSTVSTNAGTYYVPALPPGSYTVRVLKDGFEAMERTGITLYVATTTRLDLSLTVGRQEQTVTVNADASGLQLDNATVGSIIGNKDVVALPLNGRSYTQLAELAPGVALNGAVSLPVVGVLETSSLSSGASDMTISGSRPEDNEFTLDGMSVTSSLQGGTFAYPPIDSIQEFKLLQSSYGAEFGWHVGQIVLTTKTGTNTFHGSIYEFLRNDDFDAANFFATTGKNPLKQNQFGGSIGGPVYLPKYSGRNRTFFFVNYEGARVRSGSTTTTTVPTSLMRQGDFSELSKQIINPQTGLPFQGNVISPGSISPIAINVVNLTKYPLPNKPGLANNYTISPVASTELDEVVARVDHDFSPVDHVMASVFYSTFGTTVPPSTNIDPTVTSFPEGAYAINETHIFSPTLVNVVKVGFNDATQTNQNTSPSNITDQSLGFPQNDNQPIATGQMAGIPAFSVSGYGVLVPLH